MKLTKRRRPTYQPGLDLLEGRVVLSQAATTVPINSALVQGLGYLYTNGSGFAAIHKQVSLADTGQSVSVHGQAQFAALGFTTMRGQVHGTGFIDEGNATGKLWITNRQGTLLMSLTGPKQSGNKAPISGSYEYTLVGVSGQYKHKVSAGKADMLFRGQTVRIRFYGKPNRSSSSE